ncbi:hypothetical protein NQ315_012810 [Exocentrus adspersus]|uniref:Integrase catalytic domain-containing protein n=1 Tax=Exocentrus adspersus TaxID=1586481 RepID=A0AAV8V6J8_9CUCU|nr:hypothetical protein NQ315_012810 [Exocentrus adspersus]
MIEFATGYPSDIVTVINEKEFALTELVNVQLHREDIVNELHKPAGINFKRRRTIIKGLNDLIQTDLIDLISYSNENNGCKYVLIVINCFSKFVWTEPLINKSAQELQTDIGKEFYNTNFNKLRKKYKINHYSVYSTKKASIVERSIGTIKNMLWRAFSLGGEYKWIHILDDTKWMKPMKWVTMLELANIEKLSKKATHKTGLLSNPTTYLLQDEAGKEITGGFYELELQKVKHPDAHLVEKVCYEKKEIKFLLNG